MNDSPTKSSKLNQRVSELTRLTRDLGNLLNKSDTASIVQAREVNKQLANKLDHLQRESSLVELKSQNLHSLLNIGQIINSSLELNEVLRVVMDTIVRLIKAERGFLMLRNKVGKLTIRIARNWEQETIDQTEFAISRTVVSKVINQGTPVLTTNAQEDPRFSEQQSIIAHNLRSILCVPLKVKDKLTGVIYTDNRIHSGVFSEFELDLLSAIANQAAVAIENARLFESLRRTLTEVTELKNLMDNVFDSIASGVLTADIDDMITLCNRAAEEILGQSQSELIGSRLADVLPAYTHDIRKYLNTVRDTDQNIVGVELESILPQRGPISLSFNLSPLKDAEQITQGVAIVLDDLTEKKRLEAQHRLFERMVSPRVIEQLDPNQLQLGGKRTKITTLFADIRGFTHFSGKIDPEQLVTILNHYLAMAAEAVLAQEGTIDKFFGDAVMAWYNAPIPQPDHTLRAIRSALDIQNKVHEVQRELPVEYHLNFGIGIHSGEAVLGLVGTEKRLDYTAIGDSVNIAKRIQENAAPGQILISETASNQVNDQVLVRPVKSLLVKGKDHPIQVYEVVGLKMLE